MIIFYLLLSYIVIGFCLGIYSYTNGTKDLEQTYELIKDYSKPRKFAVAFILSFGVMFTGPMNILVAFFVFGLAK